MNYRRTLEWLFTEQGASGLTAGQGSDGAKEGAGEATNDGPERIALLRLRVEDLGLRAEDIARKSGAELAGVLGRANGVVAAAGHDRRRPVRPAAHD